jgi:hypothetical protein
MATRKPKPQDLSHLLQFDPHIIFDPVPWPFFTQFDRATQARIAQVQIDLTRQTLQARLNAANQISAAIKGKK